MDLVWYILFVNLGFICRHDELTAHFGLYLFPLWIITVLVLKFLKLKQKPWAKPLAETLSWICVLVPLIVYFVQEETDKMIHFKLVKAIFEGLLN